MKKNIFNRQFISTRLLFIGFIVSATIVSVLNFLFGLEVNRTFEANTAISITLISVIVFLFLSIALYFGIKLKEDVGKLTKHIKFVEPSGNYTTGNSGSDFSIGDTSDLSDDLIANILIWVFTTVLLVVTIFFLETILWSFLLILFAA